MYRLIFGIFFSLSLFVSPGVSFAGLVVDTSAPGTATTIAVCTSGAHYVGNDFVQASGCQNVPVTSTGAGSYKTADGTIYKQDCQSAPAGTGNLSISPAACNYVKDTTASNDTTTNNTSAAAADPAGGLVPCGGTGQHPCQTCDAVTLVNKIIQWLIIIMGTVAAIIIIYAGVKLVTSGGNSHSAEEAKSMISNIIIGYIILLSGWLIVDYVMKSLVLDEPGATFGVWNQLTCTTQDVPGKTDQQTLKFIGIDDGLRNLQGWVQGGNVTGGSGNPAPGSYNSSCTVLPGPGAMSFNCTTQKSQCTAAGGIPTTNSGGTSVICTPKQITVSGGGVQCNPGNIACSVAALQAAGMNSTQANVMSCIAMTESSGNPAVHSKSSSACGTFQILTGTWAGSAPSGCNSFSSCTNATCNAQAAANLVKQSGYTSWTCPGCNARAQACKDKFGG